MEETKQHKIFGIVNTSVLIIVSIVGFLIKFELMDMKERITRLENAFIEAGSKNLNR